MKSIKYFIIALALIATSLAVAGFDTDPCVFTSSVDLTVYRLPILGSTVFGTLPAGETREILAQTADGWLGFDPGIAQASNVGLARHRWIQLNASITPACLASVDMVTLGDVEHDMGINNLNPEDMVITDVQVSDLILTENAFAEVEVRIENQGDVTTSDYHLVLLSQYGTGPNQNPAGVETVPDLAPGATHTFTFSPGVTYPTAGTYTMRALLTNNWPTHADPDSTGGFGDIWDTEINVILGLCNPFTNMELSLVMLNLNPDTGLLPIYLKSTQEYFPGFDPNGNLPDGYIGELDGIQAHLVNQQDFPDRLYFMFTIPKGMEDTEQTFVVKLPDCPKPVYLQSIQIPEPKSSGPTCNVGLNEEKCTATGGTFYRPSDKTTYCACP